MSDVFKLEIGAVVRIPADVKKEQCGKHWRTKIMDPENTVILRGINVDPKKGLWALQKRTEKGKGKAFFAPKTRGGEYLEIKFIDPQMGYVHLTRPRI